MAQALLIATRPGYILALFLAGWAVNVYFLVNFRIDYGAVLCIAKEEMPSASHLFSVAVLMVLVLSSLRLLVDWQAPSVTVIQIVLLTYGVTTLGLLGWLPSQIRRHLRWRAPFARALWRCFWPAPGKEVPFAEVLVADGLTSLAKVFFDIAMSTCVALNSTSNVFLLGGLGIEAGQPGPRLGEALEECSRSSLPFLMWALPFLIRANQCIMASRNSPDAVTRILHRVNLAKYLSALPAVFFALLYTQGNRLVVLETEDFEAMWAVASMLNAVFSFVWDLVMDWGLMQPGPCLNGSFGLRPMLLFRGIWGFYYLSIAFNLMGRTLWSLRWSPQATELLGIQFLTTLQQGAEVLRRCLWNVLRIEWECIRRGVHRSDKHFTV